MKVYIKLAKSLKTHKKTIFREKTVIFFFSTINAIEKFMFKYPLFFKKIIDFLTFQTKIMTEQSLKDLAWACSRKADYDGGIAAANQCLQINPKSDCYIALEENYRLKGKSDDAINACTIYKGINPQSADCYIRINWNLRNMGKYVEAAAEMQNCINTVTNADSNMWLYIEMTYGLQVSMIPDQSIAKLDLAIAKYPNMLDFRMQKADILKDQVRNFVEAEKIYKYLISVAPKYSYRTYINLADAQQLQGKATEAIQTLNSAIAIYPTMHEPYELKCYFLRDSLGLYSTSADSMDMAIKIHPYPLFYYQKAWSLRLAGRQEEAITVYDEGLSKFPDFRDLINSKADCLNELGRYYEAATVRKKLINDQENIWGAYHGVASSLSAADHLSDALDLYNLAISKFPNKIYNLYEGKADVLSKMLRFEEAAAEYQNAINIRGNIWTHYSRKAVALRNIGKYRDALDVYNSAIQKFPSEYELVYAKCECLVQFGDFSTAIDLLGKAVVKYWKYDALKLRALFESSQYEEAVSFAGDLLTGYSTCPNCQYFIKQYIAKSLFQQGKIEEAKFSEEESD